MGFDIIEINLVGSINDIKNIVVLVHYTYYLTILGGSGGGSGS